MFFLRIFTSPAINVMLFQVMDANNAPTIATAIVLIVEKFNSTGMLRLLNKTGNLKPKIKPITTIALSDKTFVTVKIFCVTTPYLIPLEFRKLKKITVKIANSCCVEKLKLPIWNRIFVVLMAGAIIPKNFAKATHTATIVPVCITRKRVHPYKKQLIR